VRLQGLLADILAFHRPELAAVHMVFVEAGVGLGAGTEGLRQLRLVGMNTYGSKPVKSELHAHTELGHGDAGVPWGGRAHGGGQVRQGWIGNDS
jgi:hypothetical protein